MTPTRRRSLLAAVALAALALSACPGGRAPEDLVRSSGCKEDSDCRMLGADRVCRKGSCITKAEAARADADAKARKAKPKPAKVEGGTLKVRICPAYYNLDSNTGTLIAKGRTTGKKRYLNLGQVVDLNDTEDQFEMKGLPYDTYEVTYMTGVVAAGVKDIHAVKCAKGVVCEKETVRVMTLAKAAPMDEAAKKKAKAEEAKILKAQELKHGPPCDFDVNR